MKLSGNGSSQGKRRLHSKCLIVDGYNIIAKMLKTGLRDVTDLDAARDGLVDRLAEYKSFSGEHVVLVFDAHHTRDPAVEEHKSGIHVIYTAHKETADERIETLVYTLRDEFHQITVATSDYAEQQVVFGGGALRISASELIRRLKDTGKAIHTAVDDHRQTRNNRLSDQIRQDVAKILEKWRRQ